MQAYAIWVRGVYTSWHPCTAVELTALQQCDIFLFDMLGCYVLMYCCWFWFYLLVVSYIVFFFCLIAWLTDRIIYFSVYRLLCCIDVVKWFFTTDRGRSPRSDWLAAVGLVVVLFLIVRSIVCVSFDRLREYLIWLFYRFMLCIDCSIDCYCLICDFVQETVPVFRIPLYRRIIGWAERPLIHTPKYIFVLLALHWRPEDNTWCLHS